MARDAPRPRFRHEAVFYAGPEAFLDHVAPFVEEGVAAGEPVMVALEAPKLQALRSRLGADAEHVVFADMGDIGHNPACIIPAWQGLRRRALRPDARRRRADLARPQPDELVECQCHEALLNERLRRHRGLPPRLPLRPGAPRAAR